MAKEKEIPHKDYTKLILVLVIFILIVLSGYFYWQYSSKNNSPKSELEILMTKLSVAIDLPSESPTLASVKDKSKLPKDPFYAAAENGDKVLLFKTARKALLYRPSTGKVLQYITIGIANPVTNNVQAVSGTPQKSSTATSPTPTIKPKTINLALFNTTQVSGLTKIIESKIRNQTKLNINVVKRGNANGEYKKTQIVDITGNNKFEADTIAGILNGEVANQYPVDEPSVSADIAIFIVQ
jgi:hypothetical protein